MYAKNGIVYAGNDQKILHVNEAVPHGDYGLTLFFDDGSIRDFDGKNFWTRSCSRLCATPQCSMILPSTTAF